jgi:hypothetical protein
MPKNKVETVYLLPGEEHFFVTGMLYFFHDTLIKECHRRGKLRTIDSNSQLESISKQSTKSIAGQLLPLIEETLSNLEENLLLKYIPCYEDKIKLKKQMHLIFEKKRELIWGIKTKPYKKHDDLIVYQVFLPIAHACVTMGSTSLQNKLRVCGAYKTEFGSFLFSELRRNPTDFSFVDLFFDFPALHGISEKWLQWLLYLKNNTQISSQKLKKIMGDNVKKNSIVKALLRDSRRRGSSLGNAFLHFWAMVNTRFDLKDDKIDEILIFIEEMLEIHEDNYECLIDRLEKITAQINYSEKLPDYYFNWMMNVFKSLNHDFNHIYVNKKMVKQLFSLMVEHQDFSLSECDYLNFFLNQVDFSIIDMPEQGIPLFSVIYRPKVDCSLDKIFEHAFALSFSKHLPITESSSFRNKSYNIALDKIIEVISSSFWKEVVKKYKKTPEMHLVFLKKIANVWNMRPNNSPDVLFFQDFLLSIQDPDYFYAWEEWTFGTQPEWHIKGLVGLASFFEINVSDDFPIKRNAIVALSLLDCDFFKILQTLVLEKQEEYINKNVSEKHIEAWAGRRLIFLVNWANMEPRFFQNLYHMGMALGQDYMAYLEDFIIQNYLQRTPVHQALSNAVESLNKVFSNYSFLRYGERNPYSNIQIQAIQEQFYNVMKYGKTLEDMACEYYFNNFSKALNFLCFSDTELSCLALKFSSDPIINRMFVNKEFQELLEVQLPRNLRPNSVYQEQALAVRFWGKIMEDIMELRREIPNPENPQVQIQQFIQIFQQEIELLGGPVVRRIAQRAPEAGPHAAIEHNPHGLNVHIRSVHKTVAESITRLVKSYIQIEGESAGKEKKKIFQKMDDFFNYPILKSDLTLNMLFIMGIKYAYNYNYVEPVSKISLKQIVEAVICALMDPDSWPNIQALQTWRLGSEIFEPNEYERRLKAEYAQRESIINDTYLHFRNAVIRYLREYTPDKGADHTFLIEKNGFKQEYKYLVHAILNSRETKYCEIRESIKSEIREMPHYQARIQGVIDPFETDDYIKNIFANKVTLFVIDKLHRPSCPGGIVNYMVYALQGVHPDVRVDVMSKETITWRLSAAVREGFYNFFDISSKIFLPEDAIRAKALKNKFLEEINACVDSDAREQTALCFFLRKQMKTLLDEPEYRLFLEQNKNDTIWATADAVITQFEQSSLPYLPVLGAVQEQVMLGFRDQCLLYWKEHKNDMLTDEAEYSLDRLKKDWQTKGFLLEEPAHRCVFEDVLQTQRLQTLLVGSYPAFWETEAVAEAWLRKVLTHGLAQDAAQEEDKDSIFRRLGENSWALSESSSSSTPVYKRTRAQETQLVPEEDIHRSKVPRL